VGYGSSEESDLVATGVGLRWNQDEARARSFGLRWAAKCRENAKNHRIGGENAEADRGENCDAENNGHNQRNHDRNPFDLQNVPN
jgi:hypothetical protein